MNRFNSSSSSFLSSSLGNFPLRSVRCARRSACVIYLSWNRNVSPYVSRGEKQGDVFLFFCLQLSCQDEKVYKYFLVFIIFPCICVVLWYHYLFPHRFQVTWINRYRRCLRPLYAVPNERYYLTLILVLNSKIS